MPMPAFARPPPKNRGTTSARATIFLNGQCPFVPMPPLLLMGNARAARGQEENLKLCYNFDYTLNWFAFLTHKIDLMGNI